MSKNKYIAFRGQTNIGYIIAPPNASEEDKKKADLVLDDVNGSPHTQLADMVDMLHDRRGQNTDIAIVIEFCPGEFELPNGTNWVIPEGKGNFYIYGNGVKFNGNIDDDYLFHVVDCWLFDLEVKNNGFSSGIYTDNSTLTNCSGSGGGSGIGFGIYADNSTLTNCSGTGDNGIYTDNSTLTNCSGSGGGSGIGFGIYADNSTLTNCSGTGDNGIYTDNSTLTNCSGSGGGSGIGFGIYTDNSTLTNCSGTGTGSGNGICAEGSCIIQGCDGTEGGISVPNGFVDTYPNTLELLQAFNKGDIIERQA